MKDFFTKIHTTAQKVNLSTQEKADIRARVVAHIFTTEAKKVSILSPLSHLYTFSRRIQIRYVSLVAVMLLAFVGVSGAAENSLPGDSLYQVKTSVNENIRGLFAFTPQSKAQLHVELAVRRLEEVQDLAAAGKLNDGAKAEVEQKLDQHLADLKDSLLVLEQQNPAATGTVLTVSATTTIAIATSTDTLGTSTVIADATSTPTTDASSTDTIVTPSVARVMTLSIIAPVASSSVDASSTATTTSANLESKIKDASADLQAGADKVGTQDYSGAYALVKKATETTEQIKTLINDLPTNAATSTSDTATTTSAIATSTQTAAVIDAIGAATTTSLLSTSSIKK